jgi:squalene-hopene/tetraprenyl-beta-curcumene cyclase
MTTVIRIIAVAASLISFSLSAAASPSADVALERGLGYFASEQASDGSWTGLVRASSVMYTAQTIFLYEYLGQTEAKRDVISKLVAWMWTQQSATGGFAGYPGAPDNVGISVEGYLAAKIAGEDERSPRMMALEGSIERGGGLKKATLALPWLMTFELDHEVFCLPSTMESLVFALDSKMPWIRIMLYPLIDLYAQGKTHRLSKDKYPTRLGRIGGCARWTPHPSRIFKPGHARFLKWALAHLNDDGTLFDYAPTSVPTLMALGASGPKYAALVEKGVAAIESFQARENELLWQSPGEASVGETYMILHALEDLGLDRSSPLVSGAEKFLYSTQIPANGAFGFSKHNTHFPDADDTSHAIYTLERLDSGDRNLSRLERGVDWVLTIQNPDGGFGTWERDRSPTLSRLMGKAFGGKRFDLSNSGAEQTARIALNLSLFRDREPRYRVAYDKSIDWLLKQQQADGSYGAVWMVDYLYSTATVLVALATAENDPHADPALAARARAAVEKGLSYVLSHQLADGGFGESPRSFDEGHFVALPASSPAQTGMVGSLLLEFSKIDRDAHWAALAPVLERAVALLVATQGADGSWHDPSWTAVTFPGLEYLVYYYIQDIGAVQTLGMYKLAVERNLK